ncbi:MAG: NF038129 family PEP-CTERM protein [Nitrospirota bacterium]
MKRHMIKLLVIAAIMFAATSAFADYSYNFDVNTSSISGQTGYLELQFNPGLNPGVASAVISNFTSDAALGASILTGDVTGALPGAVTINNTTGWNDYFQALTFGNGAHFTLNLAGSADNSFGLSFYGADGVTSLLTSDPSGFATTIDMNANGAAINSNSSQVTVAATPIPAAAWLFGSGVMGLAGIRRRMTV